MKKTVQVKLNEKTFNVSYPNVGQEIDTDYLIVSLIVSGDILDKLLNSKRTSRSGSLILAYCFFKNTAPEIVDVIEAGVDSPRTVLDDTNEQGDLLIEAWNQIKEWYNEIKLSIADPKSSVSEELISQEEEA